MPESIMPYCCPLCRQPSGRKKIIRRTPNHYLYLEPGTGYTLLSAPIERDAGVYHALLPASMWTTLGLQQNRFGVDETTTFCNVKS